METKSMPQRLVTMIGDMEYKINVFVIYVYVGNMDDSEVEEYVRKYEERYNKLASFNDVVTMFLPTKDVSKGVQQIF